jgi:hypothetical protein
LPVSISEKKLTTKQYYLADRKEDKNRIHLFSYKFGDYLLQNSAFNFNSVISAETDNTPLNHHTETAILPRHSFLTEDYDTHFNKTTEIKESGIFDDYKNNLLPEKVIKNTRKIKIAIIAKSNKKRNNGQYGFCVAGIKEDGSWIRLVSDQFGDSLPKNIAFHCGDVILADVEDAPLQYQPENAILLGYSFLMENAYTYFKKIKNVGEIGIFGNYYNSLLPEKVTDNMGSFRYLQVNDLEIYWNVDIKCKVSFTYKDNRYTEFSLTDPNSYTVRGSEPKKIDKAYVVISLPNYTWNHKLHKFVAAIYPINHNKI